VPVHFNKQRKVYGATSLPDLRLMLAYPHDNPDYPYLSWDNPVPYAGGFSAYVSSWKLFYAVCDPSETDLNSLNNLSS
jgi:hypothetical protein